MASGRMIQRKISSNRELPRLIALLDGRMGHPHGAMAALLYTWSIAHLDCEGRMHGDPHVVKGSVVPRISFITPELTETYLLAMAEIGLVVYYEAEGDRWLAFPAFHDAQPNLRKDREAESNIPSPEGNPLVAGVTPASCRSDAGVGPAEEKRSLREDQDQENSREANTARARNGRTKSASKIPEPLRLVASAVLLSLNEARKRVIPGAQDLGPQDTNLEHIAARFTDGHSEQEIRHVIAVCEAEVRAGGDPRWFNAVTPFRREQFARKLAMTPAVAAAPVRLVNGTNGNSVQRAAAAQAPRPAIKPGQGGEVKL